MLKRFFNRGKGQGGDDEESAKGQSQPETPAEATPPTPPPAAPEPTPPAALDPQRASVPMGEAEGESEPAGPRMVYCVKLKQTLPGLERPPFSGELGQRIYDHISAAAWDMWKRQAVMLVNHYGLIGVDPDARKWLNEQMEAYLFEDDEPVPEGWLPEDQAGSAKGMAKGAPSAKGAPAPRSK